MSDGADPSSSSPPQNTVEGEGGEGDTHEDTPAAGDQGGDSNEQQDSNEVEVVEGSSAGGVPVVGPAVVYTTEGTVLEVPEETTAAVDAYPVPAGFVRKGSRVNSFMYSVGVYVEQSGGNRHKYYCLASKDCRRKKKVVPCTNGDRSNVNTHLRRAHGMQGNAGVKKASNKRGTQVSIKEFLAASANSCVGNTRVRELLCTKMVVEKFLAFSFFSSGTTWRKMIGFETAEDTPYPPLPPKRIKHLLVEMFVATKKAVMGNIPRASMVVWPFDRASAFVKGCASAFMR